MTVIQRIEIDDAQWANGDYPGGKNTFRARDFVQNVLKRRFGNGVTFATSEDLEETLGKLQAAGFSCMPDGYSFNITGPEDFEPGKTVYLDGAIGGTIPMVVLETRQHPEDETRKIARVKYRDRPRKHSMWINVITDKEYAARIKDALT